MTNEQKLIPLQNQEATELEAMTSYLLDEAKHRGATSAEVGAGLNIGLSTTVRMGDVETISFHREKGAQITVYFDQQKGSASTSDTSEDALREAVLAACHIAKYTSPDEFSGLADQELLATDFPDLDLDHPWGLAPNEAIALAKACEDRARAFDARIVNSDGASVNTSQGVSVYANSDGFIGTSRGTRHGLSCVLIAQDNEKMQRDYWYTTARAKEDLQAAEAVADLAAARTLKRLGARSVATCKVPVLYEAPVASGLFSTFLGAISGGNIYRKSSFLLDHLQQQVFSPVVTLTERPHLLRGLGSSVFDAEGVATVDREIVTDGVLNNYLLGSYSARKLGMTSTGNAGGVHNLVVKTSDYDFQAMLKQLDTGLLVTELMGQGVNMVTGDYSRGAGGFWVENGEIQYPVDEITIAGNLKDMFINILSIGNDVDHRGNILTGSVLVGEMTLAGS